MTKDGGIVELPTENNNPIIDEQDSSLASVANSTADLIPWNEPVQASGALGFTGIFVVSLMTLINLLNYIDRYTLASK